MRYFLLLFILVPITELALLIKVGSQIGFWATLAIVITTALLGTSLMRYQGVSVLKNVRLSLDKGEIPVESMFDGICLLIAGALMLTPGFITDIAGILLLIPFIRRKFASLVLKRLIMKGNFQVFQSETTSGPSQKKDPASQAKSEKPIIDVEYQEVDHKEEKGNSSRNSSPWKKN